MSIMSSMKMIEVENEVRRKSRLLSNYSIKNENQKELPNKTKKKEDYRMLFQ